MENRENRRIHLRAVAGKPPAPAKGIKSEVEILALRNALWLALHCAEQAGLDDVVDSTLRLHTQVTRDLRQLQEVA